MPTRPIVYLKLQSGRARLNVAKGVDPDWVRNLVALSFEKKIGDVARHAAPPGWTGEVVAKTYRSRPKHNLLRRLRASRAALEGRGYLAFMQRGLSVPPLIFWGEARRRWLFEFGIVATLYVNAPSIAEAYASSPDAQLLLATTSELARIHKAGLAHGDPYTRNFLATLPRPMPLDLTSWSRFGKAAQLKDLIRLAGSVIKLTNDPGQAKAVLTHYEQSGLSLPVPMATLLPMAIACSQAKDRP